MNMSDSNFFAENQYGFRSGHSTEYAALELVDRITTQMDNNKIHITSFSIFRLLIPLIIKYY